MNSISKTHLTIASAAAALLAGFASALVPHAGELLAGAAVSGALVAMVSLEARKRAY